MIVNTKGVVNVIIDTLSKSKEGTLYIYSDDHKEYIAIGEDERRLLIKHYSYMRKRLEREESHANIKTVFS